MFVQLNYLWNPRKRLPRLHRPLTNNTRWPTGGANETVSDNHTLLCGSIVDSPRESSILQRLLPFVSSTPETATLIILFPAPSSKLLSATGHYVRRKARASSLSAIAQEPRHERFAAYQQCHKRLLGPIALPFLHIGGCAGGAARDVKKKQVHLRERTLPRTSRTALKSDLKGSQTIDATRVA